MLGEGSASSRRIAFGALALLAISTVALVLISGGIENLVREIRSIRPLNFALSIAIIYLGEAVRALRLRAIVRGSGRDIGVLHSLLSRLLGRFAAAVTPGGFGGSPTRASITGTYSGAEIGEALGMSLLETFADTIWPALFLLVLPFFGVTSWFMVGVALFVVFMWLSGTLAVSSSRVALRVYSRLRVPRSTLCRIERQRSLFVSALKEIGDLTLLFTITALTVVSHMIEAYGILVLEGIWNPFSEAPLFLKVLAAVEASYILVSVPTPGGSGGVEYGLYLYLGSSLAVKWRVVQLTASLLPGAFLALLAPRLLHYIKEVSFPEVGSCEEVDLP